jgi:signal transduction histidine kinase
MSGRAGHADRRNEKVFANPERHAMTTSNPPLVYFLLVDDREQNLIALEALLSREGLAFLKAQSGEQALELLLKYDVALALVDVQMPAMSGFELAELMRGMERTRRVPIIFLTAESNDQQRRFRGYEAGAVDFLHKPIETDILKSKAEVFFDLYRQRQEVARQRDELAIMIEENKRLLEESRQNAMALQQADRRKDEFLATLAHELRNPLAPILNAAQVLRRADGVAIDATSVYEMIERQVKHLVRLVDDLMEMSRITSGKIQLQRDRMELAEAVRNALDSSRLHLESHRHRLHAHITEEPLIVHGDMVRLTQAVGNLLNNAAKYTPEGGDIWLVVQRVDNCAEVRVKDSGLGIPREMLADVFEMFTQINQHLQRSQGGLGIGLTLVKRLVELHGGTVSVASEGEGHGAEFVMRLPLIACDEHPKKHEEPTSSDAATSQRILIVDDNVDGVSSLRALLTVCGHQVETATSGLQGIEKASVFEPRVVLLDIGMPGLDGYETARKLRSLPGGERMVLVALTGWGQEEARARSREAGFDHHLVKPIDANAIEEFIASIRG